MSANTITVRLVGADEDNGAVRLNDFVDFCGTFLTCLRKFESLLSRTERRIQYRIIALGSGSAEMTLEAVAPPEGEDQREHVLGLFRDTVANLQHAKPVDPRIDYDTLERLRDLTRPLRRKVREVHLEETLVTTQFEASIDNVLDTAIPSEGSVSGVLERVNVHGRYEFVLYPPIPGYQVNCRFPESMLNDVRRAIKGNVTVWGTLRFQPDAPFPYRVQVKSMDLHPPDDELPTLADLRGSAPGCTGGIDSVAFVRGIRDAHHAD